MGVYPRGPRGPYRKQSVGERFWPKVEYHSDGGCWVWKGAKDPKGYGVFGIDYRRVFAHRVSYELVKGKVPDNLPLDHLCRNHSCVNPDHLEAVTMKTNLLRGQSLSAQEARRTHCPKGHLLFGDNLVPSMLKDGHRLCKICRKEWTRHWYHKNKRRINARRAFLYPRYRDYYLAKRKKYYEENKNEINARRREKSRLNRKIE